MIIPFCTLASPCPYLNGKEMRMEYYFVDNANFALNSHFITHGYRRFGRYFSRPICADCMECKSIRTDVSGFVFSKSQRKLISKNSNLISLCHPPQIDENRLELYQKYHEFMREKRGWSVQEMDFDHYVDMFIIGGGDFSKEVAYYSDNKLVCVDLIDFTADGISSVYCYYDPEFAHLSLGKYSLLMQFLIAKRRNLPWIYPGFYVKECQSLAYKGEYKPYQTLDDGCDLFLQDIWRY